MSLIGWREASWQDEGVLSGHFNVGVRASFPPLLGFPSLRVMKQFFDLNSVWQVTFKTSPS